MFDLLTYLEGCESLLSFSTVRAKLDVSKRTLRKMVARACTDNRCRAYVRSLQLVGVGPSIVMRVSTNQWG
jgi:hypothetical protein